MAAAPLLLNLIIRSSFPEKTAAISFPQRVQCCSLRPCSSASSSYNHPPLSEEAVLEAVASFDTKEKNFPAVRTFENDLARLTVVGAVGVQQALTAAAADGGEAVDEHISSGLDAMVVETVYPGPSEDRSTVSTRLFLPARKVKEKAIVIRKSLPKDVWDVAMSKNILAMTFKQVVFQQLWSLELALFRPGNERDLDNLENPREVPVFLNLSSSDERVISLMAEVVCVAALEGSERHIIHDSMNTTSNRLLSLFNKPKHISSSNASVVLYNLLEHEIIANARTLLEKFNLERGKDKFKGRKLKNSWWTSTAFSKLEKIGGPEFCSWISEWVPSYMLEIDADKLSDVKFEGWKKSEANRWEVVLTHSQMVCLADILDMYYEDSFTLPNKILPCNAVSKSSNLGLNKGSFLLKMFANIFVSGIFLVTISVLRKLYLPHLPVRTSYVQENSKPVSSDVMCIPHHTVDLYELEAACVSIIQRIKDFYGWPGEIRINSDGSAWIGEVPMFLRELDDSDSSRSLGANDKATEALEDIASYQVVLSTDWKIIGFQPTNRVAVNNWASNPLAGELYGGKKLSPGLIEPRVKISRPSGALVLELLMSLNPKSYFALVRTVDISGGKK